MENYIESQELQQMKQQIRLLKEKLNCQTIVNDGLIRRAMKRNISSINRYGIISIVLCIAFTPFCVSVFARYGFSVWFCAATVALMLFSALMTYIYHRDLWNTDLSRGNMLLIGRIVSRLKERYARWIYIAIPLILIWFLWLVYEALMNLNANEYLSAFLPGACFGVLIGGIIGNRRRKLIVQQAEEVLAQVEDLLRDEVS
ncbi:MAG: hypothetical protein E7099_08875 [Mediterranea massiliensis]|nr:hypothetical protein [Mediterranea massiliensis]